jgi:hypothetical protein
MPQSTETIRWTPSACRRSMAGLQAVAVAEALGDEVDDVAAEHLDHPRRMTVDVIPSTS